MGEASPSPAEMKVWRVNKRSEEPTFSFELSPQLSDDTLLLLQLYLGVGTVGGCQ